MKVLATIGVIGLAAQVSWAALVEREVSYQAGDTTMKGFLVYDDAQQGPRPGVLVVHEWWGHNDYARKRARMLAEAGYVALAADMYGDGKVADHPDNAGAFASEVMKNMPAGEARFRAAREVLASQPQTDAAKIAAIGYCFGGAVVLHMARIGEDLDAVASFHGSLGTETPAHAGAVKARVFVFTGGSDPMVPEESVRAFEQEMQAAGAFFRVITYPGAKHSFTVPEADANAETFGLPLGYDAEADRLSWEALLSDLRDAFSAP